MTQIFAIIRKKNTKYIYFLKYIKSMWMVNLRCQLLDYKQLGIESHFFLCLWVSPEIINWGRRACTKSRGHLSTWWELEVTEKGQRKMQPVWFCSVSLLPLKRGCESLLQHSMSTMMKENLQNHKPNWTRPLWQYLCQVF